MVVRLNARVGDQGTRGRAQAGAQARKHANPVVPMSPFKVARQMAAYWHKYIHWMRYTSNTLYPLLDMLL